MGVEGSCARKTRVRRGACRRQHCAVVHCWSDACVAGCQWHRHDSRGEVLEAAGASSTSCADAREPRSHGETLRRNASDPMCARPMVEPLQTKKRVYFAAPPTHPDRLQQHRCTRAAFSSAPHTRLCAFPPTNPIPPPALRAGAPVTRSPWGTSLPIATGPGTCLPR